MNRDTFLEQKDRLACQHCGAIGLEPKHYPDNDGMRAWCPHCDSVTPLPGVQFLPKVVVKTPKRAKVDVKAIWEACGNHCTHCGRSRAFLERLGIGLQVQHMVPHWKAGDAFPVVPYCARCHQASTAEQEASKRLEARETELQDVIRRIEERFPHLRGEFPS